MRESGRVYEEVQVEPDPDGHQAKAAKIGSISAKRDSPSLKNDQRDKVEQKGKHLHFGC